MDPPTAPAGSNTSRIRGRAARVPVPSTSHGHPSSHRLNGALAPQKGVSNVSLRCRRRPHWRAGLNKTALSLLFIPRALQVRGPSVRSPRTQKSATLRRFSCAAAHSAALLLGLIYLFSGASDEGGPAASHWRKYRYD